MTETLTVHEVNCETGEETVRPFTAEELAQRAKDVEAFATKEAEREAEAQAQADAKASALAKLTALGLTEEEAKAITG
jgi:hypothetical protein